MNASMEEPTTQLAGLIAQGKLSLDALHLMTGIDSERLTSVLKQDPHPTGMRAGAPTLSEDENMRLSVLAGHLAHGFDIPDDDRIRAIAESLITEGGLTVENIALLAGVDADVVRAVSTDPGSVSPHEKYAFAVRGSYLVNAVNRARPRQTGSPL